jgi:uncharacterized protein (DUF302 family)
MKVLQLTREQRAAALASDAAEQRTGVFTSGIVATGAGHKVALSSPACATRGLSVVARVDHAAGAARVGKTLRPTELLIFGNPQGGTALMECAQAVGIDLPLKALVWDDANGQVWIGYNDPAYLAKHHEVADCPAVGNLSKALSSLVDAAAK